MTDAPSSTHYQGLSDASILSWRLTLARRLFQTISIISVPAFLAAIYYALDEGTYLYLPIYALFFIFMFVVSFWKRVPDSIRIWGLLGLIYSIILLDFYTEGRGSLARAFMVTFAFMATIFFGRRGAILSIILGLLTMIGFAYLYTARILPDYLVNSLVVSGWISNIIFLAIIMIVIAFSVDYLVSEMTAFLTRSHQLNQIVEVERAELEKRVYDRTVVAETARAEAEAAAAETEIARRDLESQIWLATGQTQLADAMRGEQDIPQLADNIILQVCQYIGAQAGALFLLEGQTIDLAGRYAFAGRTGFDGNFKVGEGLVGQAALDGKILSLENIPSDAVTISTGLVNIAPRQILALPFFANGEVVGVLELVSLSTFTPTHLELLKRTSERIGVAFRTAQTRQRLAELLKESQQQAEELQAQEEELRAANEELQAQAETLQANRGFRK